MKLIKAPAHGLGEKRKVILESSPELLRKIAKDNGGNFTPEQIREFLEKGERIYTNFSFYQRAD